MEDYPRTLVELVPCQLVWQGPTFDMLNIAATLFPLLSLHLAAFGGQVIPVLALQTLAPARQAGRWPETV